LKSTDATRLYVREEANGANGHNGSTSSESAEAAAKRGAHRLNTGAQPVVGEPVSMRPRNEPMPEPAELFRPADRDEKTSEPGRPAAPGSTVKVAAAQPSNGADGRLLSPVPPGAGKSDGRTN
jgi:hypothetical protein